MRVLVEEWNELSEPEKGIVLAIGLAALSFVNVAVVAKVVDTMKTQGIWESAWMQADLILTQIRQSIQI